MSTAYFSKQKYLPKWFRDFHVQKTFFKMMHKRQDENYRLQIKEDKNQDIIRYLQSDAYKNFNWRECHCYVIDRFLWFMAKCGYTLQKDRKLLNDPKCYDVFKMMDEYENEIIKEFAQMIKTEKEIN